MSNTANTRPNWVQQVWYGKPLETIANQTILSSNHKSVTTYKDGQTYDIIREILDTDKLSSLDTAAFAPYLRGKDLLDTLSNVWHFVKQNIRYKLDPIGYQYVKTPARTWADKYADCKSYSIFIASLLKNLGIPFHYRFTSYIQNGDFTHVYVIVPSNGNEIIVDCVMPRFNAQKPFARKKDYDMTQISRLSGLGQLSTKIIDLGPKPIGEITEGEMDLLLARDRLLTEKQIVEKNRGIGTLTAEKYHDSIDMIDDALVAANEYINGISDDIDTDFALIARQAVSGEYSTAHEIMGIGAVNRLAFRKAKRKGLKLKRTHIKKRLTKAQRAKIWGLPELSGNNPTVGFLKKIAKKIKGAVKKVAKATAKVAKGAAKGVAKGAKGVAKGVAKGAKAVAKGAKVVVKAAVKVVTAPLRLLAKGVLEVTLPKSAPFFLYLFITDPKLLAKMPASVQAKRRKSEKIADFIVNGIGMKRSHFMAIVRNGIMKHYGKSPENVLAEMTKGIAGIGIIPIAVVSALISIIQKIGKLLGKKGESVSASDAPDPNDFKGQITETLKNELVNEIKSQPENRSALNTDSENPELPLTTANTSNTSTSSNTNAQTYSGSSQSYGGGGGSESSSDTEDQPVNTTAAKKGKSSKGQSKEDFPAGGKSVWNSLR
jgi:hypothetical protein